MSGGGMRLAFCNATRTWGGVKTWTLEFARALADLGHQVRLYGRAGVFLEKAAALGLPATVVAFGPDFNPRAIAFFRREFREYGTEAVLVNVGRDLRTAGVAAKLSGLPLVQRIGLPGDMKNSLKVRLLNAWLRPHYLCPCRYIRDGLLDNLPFIAAKATSVVYSAKQPLPAPPTTLARPLRLVTTSQVNPNKGHEELLRVLARYRDAGQEFTWDVAGTGESLDFLRGLSRELGLAERVRWHGFCSDIGSLLREADVFVLPSYTEGLPNTLLEAMAHGLVPVARNAGGSGEVWPEALAALLAPDGPHDGSGLTAALGRVFAADEATLLAWKRIAWEQCREHFSLTVQAHRLEEFFRQRLDEAGRGNRL